MITALIVAAGQGVRMGTAQRKQYLTLCGRPILAHTLRAFDSCAQVAQIVLVVPESEIDYCRRDIVPTAGLRHDPLLVPGGARRQDSVYRGLQCITAPDDVVLIHDGVRPLVTHQLIERCIEGARQWGACIPVVPVTDTLKRIDARGAVAATVPREALCMAQTPQAFHLSLIKRAHQWAREHEMEATDDASLVERMGTPVHTIAGLPTNIKITSPMDLRRAEAYFSL